MASNTNCMKSFFEEQRVLLDYFFSHFDYQQAEQFVDLALSCEGFLVFSGVGKSGFIANKVAMSLTSTGVKSIFLSPLDALHGDIGVLSSHDILVLFSKSGNTQELLRLLPTVRDRGARVVSVTCSEYGALSQKCDLHVHLPLQRELCSFNSAPVTSTILQLIFGDTVTAALMQKRCIDLDVYASNHPAGSIGKQLLFSVNDIMVSRSELPVVTRNDLIKTALLKMTEGRLGCVFVNDNAKGSSLCGIFTDGDLRRGLEAHGESLLGLSVESCMTTEPRTITSSARLRDALSLFNLPTSVQCLPVVDPTTGDLIGAINLCDISGCVS